MERFVSRVDRGPNDYHRLARMEADWRWRPIWNLVDIPEITFHRCRCGKMGMLSAIGWISAAGRNAVFRRDRAIHARGNVLSLSLGEGGKRMTSLFSISGGRSIISICPIPFVPSSWKFFKKKRKEKDARGLDKRARPSFLKDGRWRFRLVSREWDENRWKELLFDRDINFSFFFFFQFDRVSIKPISSSSSSSNDDDEIKFNPTSNLL